MKSEENPLPTRTRAKDEATDMLGTREKPSLLGFQLTDRLPRFKRVPGNVQDALDTAERATGASEVASRSQEAQG